MRKNRKTKIVGNKVVLVPYRKSHVKRYNEWMQSKELQELTASDPLTEEEEYEMQQTWLYDEDKSMVGDTNLYLSTSDDDGIEAETGLMIAEPSARRKRLGWEAVLLNFRYGIDELNVNKFVAKISKSNEKSIDMFKKIGFQKESESEIFQEVTLSRIVSEDWIKWLKDETTHYVTEETEENT